MNREDLIRQITEGFDLERIKDLPVTEKFRLVEYAKLIYSEAHLTEQKGLLALEASDNYTIDQTYNMLAMLVVKGTEFKYVKEIIVNYSMNFNDSDMYYSKIAFLGIGVLMIDKRIKPAAIFNYLLTLLGEEFLSENLKYNGLMEMMSEQIELDVVISYKSFDYTYRKLKYQFLAILKSRLENGLEHTTSLINNVFKDKKMQLYYQLLNIDDVEIRDILYKNLTSEADEMNKLYITAAYAITSGISIYVAHYLFNSVIGKYSRYDKAMKEVDEEIDQRLSEILAME